MELWILLCFSLYRLVIGQEIQEPTLKECCEDGRDRALGGQDCAIIPLFSSSHICRIAQEQCCAAVVIDRLCSNGIDMAKEQGTCDRPFFQGVPWETRLSKTCCDCCVLGLMAVGQGQSCELGLSLGKQCAHAAETCCGKNSTEEATPITQAPVTTDITSSSDVTSRSVTSSNVTSTDVTTLTEKEKDFCQEHNCSQLCVSGACACRRGYQLKTDGVTCGDVNECLNGAHVCVLGQACINTEGSYRCQRKTSCGTGYQLTDDNQCQDIDECAFGTHYCGDSFVCNNTPGSFRCHPKERCGGGFIQDAIGSCIDINECVAQTSPCRPGQTCINTMGSYTCLKNTVTCGRGYRLIDDATRCEDVDECRVGDACGGHGCVNLIGTYRCECRAGFVFNSHMKLCEDINECRHYPGRLCAHKCENTEGSYHCSCTTGFKLSNDGRNCEDVNECEASPCTQECANVYGSYQCYCRRGYQLSDIDGITCEDIDECALPTGGHVCSYRCVNSPGSFFCTCPPTGYTLAPNGRSCQDIDECAAGSHSCSVTESCFNIQGGFRCLSFDCPHNFKRASEGRCERVTCEFTRDPAACLSLPLRISFYTVTVPADAPVPADVFRMGPSNAVPGDSVLLDIVSGDEDGYFGAQQRPTAHGGVISLRRSPTGPRDFFLTVEMRLVRYGRTHLYMAKIAVFVTHEQPLRLGSHTRLEKNGGSVGVRCVKACQPRDVSCAVDPVRLITHTVISLPTYRDFTAAEDIVFLRTMVPNSPLPGATNVFFDIVASDSEHSFDVVKRVHYDMIMGVVRQVKPIIGPSNVVVEVSMNYIKSGVVSHRNIVVIHVFVSEFWF